MAKVKATYTIREASHLADLSVRMIDYLCRMKIVVPTASRKRGRGNERLFSFGDVLMLRSIQCLLQNGVSVSRLKDDLKKARQRYKGLRPESQINERYIVTNGVRAYFETERGVVDLVMKPDQYVFKFILDLERTRGEILARSAEAPKTASRPRAAR